MASSFVSELLRSRPQNLCKEALLDRVEVIEGIQRGLADVKAARTKPARQAFDRLRRKHGIPR